MINGYNHSTNVQGNKTVQGNQDGKNRVGQSTHTDSSASNKAPESESAKAESHNVSLSKEAKMMQEIEQRLVDQGSVNQSKVSDIKQQLESGSFSINSESIANKMMNLDSLY